MSDVHAGPGLVPHAGRCLWSSHFDDCYLSCDDPCLPGEHLCAVHYIAAVHRAHDAERAAVLLPRHGFGHRVSRAVLDAANGAA